MKKTLSFILSQLKYFFVNPFWKSWVVLVALISSIIINSLIWYFYLTKLKEFVNITPIYFALGVLILNLFLAVVSYPKEKFISQILIYINFVTQAIILFFLLISLMFGGF